MVTIWSQCLGLGCFRCLLGVLHDGGEQVRGLLVVARHGVRVPVERYAGVRMAAVCARKQPASAALKRIHDSCWPSGPRGRQAMAPTTISHAIRFKGSCHEGAGQRVHERPARRDGPRVVQARAVRKPSGRLSVTGSRLGRAVCRRQAPSLVALPGLCQGRLMVFGRSKADAGAAATRGCACGGRRVSYGVRCPGLSGGIVRRLPG